MPAVVVGAAASAAFSAAAGATLFGLSVAASAGIVFGGSLLLGAISYALTPKPKTPSFSPGVSQSNISVRQPDLTRQNIYGHTRVTRGFAHMEVTGVNDQLHLILILCEGPLRAINEIWVDDYAIPNDWINASGTVTQGRYANKMTIRKHLGTIPQAADTVAIANLSDWTINDRLDGIAYLYIILTKDQDVYPNGIPNFSAIVEGPTVYDPRTDTSLWTTNIALFAHDFIRNDTYGLNAFEDDVDITNISAQANICDEIVDTEADDAELVSVATGTDLITLDGNILKFQFGDRVQIVTSGTPPGGLSTGVDYYVIPYQVRDTPRIQLASTLANSMAKVAINLTSSGSGSIIVRKNGEPRYHGGGVFDTESELSETLNNIASSMAGRAICVAGAWTLLAGAWRTPVDEFTISDVRGEGIGIQTNLSMAESYNVVKGIFVSPVNMYQQSDYPSAVYEQFIADDNDLESPKELNLPFTNRPTTAQRIAKIELFRGRQGIVLMADFSMKGLQVQTGDVISVTMDRYGWEEKEFEVTEFGLHIQNNAMFTRMSLRETAQAIYDWSSGEAIEFDPAPNTNLPNPFLVFVPTGVAYNSREIDTRDGDVVYALTLNWDLHPDLFVREFGDFEVQFKLSAESEWRPSFFVDGELTNTDVVNSSVNIPYDLRIRARNNLGVRSGWVTILGAVVGSSGGVTDTEDWGSVADTVSASEDWGSVADTVSADEDWGGVV